jgi:hypothetical protein
MELSKEIHLQHIVENQNDQSSNICNSSNTLQDTQFSPAKIETDSRRIL